MFNFSPKPIPLLAAIGDGFKLFSQTFLHIGYWSFLFHFIQQLPTLLQLLSGQSQVGSATSSGFFILYVMAFLIQIYGTVFLMHRMYALIVSPTVAARVSFLVARQKLLPALLASLWVLTGISLLLLIVRALNLNFSLTVVLLMPLLCFLSVLLILYLPFILFDKASAVSALKKSALLVWGHWWETALMLLIPSLIGLGLILFTVLIQSQPSVGLTLSMVVISSLIAPLTYAMILVRYNQLRLLKHEPGLLQTNGV